MKRSTSRKVSQVWGKEERFDRSFRMTFPLLARCCGFVENCSTVFAQPYESDWFSSVLYDGHVIPKQAGKILWRPRSAIDCTMGRCYPVVWMQTCPLGCHTPELPSLSTRSSTLTFQPLPFFTSPKIETCIRSFQICLHQITFQQPRPRSLSFFVFSFPFKQKLLSSPKFDNARLLANWPAW